MAAPSQTVPRRASWRDLPPHPPYGPVPPPRPGQEHAVTDPLADAPAGPDPGSPPPGRTALIVGGLILALATGVGLGLLLTGTDDAASTAQLDQSDRPAGRGGTDPRFSDPGQAGQADPAPAQPDPELLNPDPLNPGELNPDPLAPGVVPQQSLQELLQQFRDQLGIGEDGAVTIPRLFEVTYLPEGYRETGTTIRRQRGGAQVDAEQTSTLSGPAGEIAVRATRGSDAVARYDDLAQDDAAAPAQVGGHEGRRVGSMRLAWMAADDLLIEVDVPAGLADGELERIADGVQVLE